MCEGYILEWLDALISISLNPVKTDFNKIQSVHSMQIESRISDEKNKIQTFLLTMVFSLEEKKRIELFIKKHHSSLTILLDKALENHANCPVDLLELKELTNKVIFCVDELLTFIKFRFPDYLDSNERVPATCLLNTKKDLRQKFERLKKRLNANLSDGGTIDIIFQELNASIACSKHQHAFTFRQIFYIKELCKELENLNITKSEVDTYSALDQLLTYMNFNSRLYIDNFTRRVTDKLNRIENMSDQMETLLFHLKKFKQLHRKPNFIFDSTYNDLYAEISNWFSQEILYLEKKLQCPNVALNAYSESSKDKSNNVQKILCILSVDQMAIVLRSVDDLQIIVARSLNAVFKTIVPYLSTSSKKDISYDSMRSKSYAIETRDKEIVIQTLERMVKKIREY